MKPSTSPTTASPPSSSAKSKPQASPSSTNPPSVTSSPTPATLTPSLPKATAPECSSAIKMTPDLHYIQFNPVDDNYFISGSIDGKSESQSHCAVSRRLKSSGLGSIQVHLPHVITGAPDLLCSRCYIRVTTLLDTAT
ncbi:hypothetical protein CFP56_041948 [Quercus suber]|uniref:Uncharacterized protein n=1 Tax=Quercus suber TaxID=58331 RepID=A0AAW0LJW4_QUESU